MLWHVTSALSMCSPRRRWCRKPTAHCNRSCDPADLYWRSSASVVTSRALQRVKNVGLYMYNTYHYPW